MPNIFFQTSGIFYVILIQTIYLQKNKRTACEFCNYKDLCYMREPDQVYLDKVDDLSFLGGDE